MNYSLTESELWEIRLDKLHFDHTRLVIEAKCTIDDCPKFAYEHDINSFVIQDFTMEFYDDFKLTNYAVGKFEGKSSCLMNYQ